MWVSSFCLLSARKIISAIPLDGDTLPTPQQMTSHESWKRWRRGWGATVDLRKRGGSACGCPAEPWLWASRRSGSAGDAQASTPRFRLKSTVVGIWGSTGAHCGVLAEAPECASDARCACLSSIGAWATRPRCPTANQKRGRVALAPLGDSKTQQKTASFRDEGQTGVWRSQLRIQL